MKKLSKAELRWAAISRHYRDEIEAFDLQPWECAPVFADGDPPDPNDKTGYAETWAKARALREQLLAANPNHYADIGE